MIGLSEGYLPGDLMVSQSGVRMVLPGDPPKDPLVAALLSFLLFGGAGQIYLGQVTKGVVLIVVTIVLSCTIVGLLISAFIPIVGAVDAYRVGSKLANDQAVGEWEFF
jgi:TM2 domain-containing membrane protein YozV